MRTVRNTAFFILVTLSPLSLSKYPDLNSDGFVDSSEFADFSNLRKSTSDIFFKAADLNQDGFLDEDEFKNRGRNLFPDPSLRSSQKSNLPKMNEDQQFDVKDDNQDGFITPEEYANFWNAIGLHEQKMKVVDVERMFANKKFHWDTNGDGKVSKKEWEHLIHHSDDGHVHE